MNYTRARQLGITIANGLMKMAKEIVRSPGARIFQKGSQQMYNRHGKPPAQLQQSNSDPEDRFAELKRAQEALRIGEERLRLALDGTTDGIWDWNPQTGEAYFSPRYYTMLGYEPGEFPGSYESWRKLLHPDDLARCEAEVQRAVETCSAFSAEFRARTKDGKWRWILGRGKVVEIGASGRAIRVAGSHTDIDEGKRAQIALHQSEQKFRMVVENASPIIFILDENGVFKLSEGRELASLGLKPGEVVGQSALELYRDVPSVVEGIRMALEGKTQRSVDLIGDIVFETIYSPLLGADGRQKGLIGIAVDITERSRAEEALRREKRFSDDLIDGMPGVFYVVDEKGRFVRWNQRLETTTGFTTEEINRMRPTDLFRGEERARIDEAIREVFEKGEAETEADLSIKGGRTIPYRFTGLRILIDGKPHVLGVGVDISDRKRAEEALEKRIVALTRPIDTDEAITLEDLFDISAIQRLQDLYAEAFGVAALITRPDGSPITQPSQFTELCGQIIRKTPLGMKNCIHSDAMIGRHNPAGPNIQPCLSAGLCNAGASITVGGHHVANWLIGQVRDETQGEEEIVAYARQIGADEDAFRAAYRKVPVMSQEQFARVARIIFELANQISTIAYQNVQQARFIAERKQAEEALRKYELIVSTSQDVMALINGEYQYEAVNESLLKALGKVREQVVGRKVEDLMGETFFREKIQPRLDCALSGQTVRYQESFEFAGVGYKIMDVSYSPLRDKEGSVQGVVLNARDITETRRLEEQLIQSQKIEAIGTLAGGVAHEINNPINGIMNYAQLILDLVKKEDPSAEFAQEILKETERIAAIVKNLLTFARQEKRAHSPAHMADIISSVLSLVQTVMRHDQIDLQVDIEEGLPKFKCRSQQIQQVLMNLMTNSRDALNERYPGYSPDKRMRVATRLVEKEGKRYIRTTVEDTGAGIQPENRERIFDPFFTTKPKETGTGLGLSISYGIVKDHHGELVVESEPGRYTRFHMDLPVDSGWSL